MFPSSSALFLFILVSYPYVSHTQIIYMLTTTAHGYGRTCCWVDAGTHINTVHNTAKCSTLHCTHLTRHTIALEQYNWYCRSLAIGPTATVETYFSNCTSIATYYIPNTYAYCSQHSFIHWFRNRAIPCRCDYDEYSSKRMIVVLAIDAINNIQKYLLLCIWRCASTRLPHTVLCMHTRRTDIYCSYCKEYTFISVQYSVPEQSSLCFTNT